MNSVNTNRKEVDRKRKKIVAKMMNYRGKVEVVRVVVYYKVNDVPQVRDIGEFAFDPGPDYMKNFIGGYVDFAKHCRDWIDPYLTQNDYWFEIKPVANERDCD